uniref:NADH dehydrogenase subunit 4L n=1 Tax=Raillietina tetragona TaxID=984823 RepID=A0A0U1Z4N8_9CEST|nr:NADH dehydrogenase subunit 4L [Raillietina tetragona]
MIASVFVLFLLAIFSGFFLSFSRFLNCLIMLENFNVLLLIFCLVVDNVNNHMIFIALMVVSTIEVMAGLIILTRVWNCSPLLELGSF